MIAASWPQEWDNRDHLFIQQFTHSVFQIPLGPSSKTMAWPKILYLTESVEYPVQVLGVSGRDF